MGALVFLTFYATGVMGHRRFKAVKDENIDPLYFKTKQVGEPPREMLQSSELYVNMYEKPVLFYVAGLSAMILNAVDTIFFALACLYVLLRVFHAHEYLRRNRIVPRFGVWTASTFTLLIMWAWLLFATLI